MRFYHSLSSGRLYFSVILVCEANIGMNQEKKIVIKLIVARQDPSGIWCNFLNAMTDVEKIAEKAGKEFGIEMPWIRCLKLEKLFGYWNLIATLALASWRVSRDYHDRGDGISTFKDCLNNKLITGTPHYKLFRRLIDDEWIQLQRHWLFLQLMFDSADINQQRRRERKRFTHNW